MGRSSRLFGLIAPSGRGRQMVVDGRSLLLADDCAQRPPPPPPLIRPAHRIHTHTLAPPATREKQQARPARGDDKNRQGLRRRSAKTDRPNRPSRFNNCSPAPTDRRRGQERKKWRTAHSRSQPTIISHMTPRPTRSILDQRGGEEKSAQSNQLPEPWNESTAATARFRRGEPTDPEGGEKATGACQRGPWAGGSCGRRGERSAATGLPTHGRLALPPLTARRRRRRSISDMANSNRPTDPTDTDPTGPGDYARPDHLLM
uniref:Uncharacterized protein n=1 Tax=Plectus sambesii TaxID=2011161 RepID=A0A914VDG8_9BILA